MKMTRSQPSLLTLLASEWSRKTNTASEREEKRLEIESQQLKKEKGAHLVKTPWPFTELWGFFI